MSNTLASSREQMLTAPVRPLTVRIAAPSLMAMLATGLSNLLDALFVAKAGESASSAVSLCFALLTLIQAVGFTLGMGAGSFVSRSLGRGEQEEAQQVASTALAVSLALGIALALVGNLLTTPLMRLLGASQEALPDAVRYARCVLLAAPCMCLSLVLSSLLRGEGRTVANMIAFAAGGALGVLLSGLLCARMGVLGAGISLLAREGLIFLLLAAFTLTRPGPAAPKLRAVTLSLWVFPAIMRSGLPTLLRQGLMSISSALLSRVSAGFGPAALAGMGIAVRAGALISSAVIGFGQGFQPVCGFNYGAGELGRVREAYRFCQRCVLIALAITGAAVFLASGAILRLFGAPEEVAAFGRAVLRAQSPVFFAQGAVIMMNMLTQAMGLTGRATLVATSRQGIFFIPLLLILPRLFGQTGLIFCQSAADLLALGFSWLLTRNVPAQDAAPVPGRKIPAPAH